MMYINSFNLGGAEKLVYDISEYLNSQGVSVSILSIGEITSPLEIENADKMRSKGINVLSINKKPGKNRLKAIKDTISILKKQKIDILHTHGQSPDFFGRTAKVFVPKVKIITTIHNTRGYNKKVELLLQNATNEYTCVSREAQEYAKNELSINKNIELIYNGIDINRYLKGEFSEESIILSVGRVTEQKGYHKAVKYVCDFLEENSEFCWYIIGHYDESDAYYNNLINEIPAVLRNRVVFTGAISNPEKYYKSATCFLLPSLYEGFGIAYIEALAAGLPIISTKVGIISEILNQGAEILLITEFEQIKKLIEIAVKDNNDSSRITNIGIASEFSIESIAQQYKDIYTRTLNY